MEVDDWEASLLDVGSKVDDSLLDSETFKAFETPDKNISWTDRKLNFDDMDMGFNRGATIAWMKSQEEIEAIRRNLYCNIKLSSFNPSSPPTSWNVSTEDIVGIFYGRHG